MPGPTAPFLAAMLAWASQVSGLPVPAGMPLPAVSVSAASALGHYADGDPWVGLTDMLTGAIVLHAGWRESDLEDRCILAHEIVHHLQVVHRLHYDPPTGAEPLAYRTTALCYAAYRLPRREIAWAWRQVRKFGG